MIYDLEKEKLKKHLKGKLAIGIVILFIIVAAVVALNIYLETIQLSEIGVVSVYLTNLTYKLIFGVAGFVIIFAAITLTNIFVRRNLNAHCAERGLPSRKLPIFSVAALISLIGSLLTKDAFYQKALVYMGSTSFNTADPIYGKDVGYYIFQRPFLMSMYDFVSSLWLFVIIYAAIYYIAVLFTVNEGMTLQDLKIKSIMRHNLINIAIFFLIKTFSYKFIKEGILYSQVVDSTGAGYVQVNVWLKYFAAAPFLLILIVILSFVFITRGRLKTAAYTIAVFPAIWVLVSFISAAVQSFIVNPNEFNLESKYIKNNIEMTRMAYGIDKIKTYDFTSTQELTPDIIKRNSETKNNIRIIDIPSTIRSNIQLQSNTNFYSFADDADIINYTINGKDIPVLVAAREISKNTLPDKTYLNTTYKYTHGFGIVMNPINKITPEGQVDFILGGLRMKSTDSRLNITQPRIYYGELTKDHVIVDAANGLNEIDYDGNTETRYEGRGGIKLSFFNRLLFALKYSDFNMLISGYASDAKLLLNREVVGRAQRPVPFLMVDKDPYIIPTSDGGLKWVLDAYTVSDSFPYAQRYGNINYIRNSVKITVDAYNGDVRYYIIDKDDPLIMAYNRIYPGIFTEEPLPADIADHIRYPEMLFKIQTELLKRYHLKPDEVSTFYSKQDLWDVAKYSTEKDASNPTEIDPYYNMLKLPDGISQKEELILMRPFTPSGELKHNMVSWLAVRNSKDNYGQMILFNFPKNTNIFGPNQVEVKINQIDRVSKDMTLWGQSGSDVYKGNLLVIPIENSVLYVEPIYIRAAGASSIPEVREIVVGFQKGDEFKYGIGSNLDEALAGLFGEAVQAPAAPSAQPSPQESAGGKNINQQTISDILNKYNSLKKQLDELGDLINTLGK